MHTQSEDSPGRFGPAPGDGRPDPAGPRRVPGGRWPDPVAIWVRAVPEAAPPYDRRAGRGGDARAGDGGVLAGGGEVPAGDGAALAGGGEVPAGDGAALAGGGGVPAGDGAALAGGGGAPAGDGAALAGGGGVPAGDGARAGAAGLGGGDGGRARPGRARPEAEAGQWPSRFAQVLAETLAGERPPAQLTPWTTQRARSQIRRLGPLLTAGQRPVVQRIVTSRPAVGVVEMSVIVGCGARVRGLAVRLERPPGPGPHAPWLCTAVEAA
jgi:Family of unknown function (DUF6459)